MEDKLRINIQLAGAKHPLYIDPADEPIARQAARLVSERHVAYATKYRGAKLPEEHLMALAAVDIAMRYVRLLAKSDVEQAAADIAALADDLEEAIA